MKKCPHDHELDLNENSIKFCWLCNGTGFVKVVK